MANSNGRDRIRPAPLSLDAGAVNMPYPDDIIIDHANGPRFVGPIDAYEQTKLNETIRLRDTLIMQDELDNRSTVRLNGEPLTEPGSAALLSFILDMGVPPRLQLSETQRVLKPRHVQARVAQDPVQRLA